MKVDSRRDDARQLTSALGHNGLMAAKADAAIDDIAAELYALPLEEFTATRNARAKQISDGELAAAVRGLKKPLLAAWVVNLFARERSDELAEALELAGQLREAQEDLDARTLSTLTRQRRALIHALAQQAAELAGSRGEKLTQASSDAVEQTLNAAMFDVDAAAAVASGRLIRPLEAGESIDLTEVLAGTRAASAPRASRTTPTDELKARRRRKEAERALRGAESELAQAERAVDELEHRGSEAGDEAARLDARADELETELARIRNESDRVKRKRDALRDEQAEAQGRADEARSAVAAAQAALDGLE